MWQRFKDAVDTRIAEEQARQKLTTSQQSSPRTSSSRPRSNSRAISPSRRQKRDQDGTGKDIPTTKGPDPSEFDPEFVIGDGNTPAHGVSPAQNSTVVEDTVMPTKQHGNPDVEQIEEGGDVVAAGKASPTPTPVLPVEVQQKLRKLERLEPKYSDLLRSYRVAHARISAIEPFEATLRENTSLTSINEPEALVEYLNQSNLKVNMVMDEMKRVFGERDELKKKLDAAEQTSRRALADLEVRRQQKTAHTLPISDTLGETVSASTGESAFKDEAEVEAEDADFFSYESELPRLQGEVQEFESRLIQLQEENNVLRGDLASAKASSERLLGDLEASTRDLQNLRENKEKPENNLSSKHLEPQSTCEDLTSKLETAEKKLQMHQTDNNLHQGVVAALEEKLCAANEELRSLQSASKDTSGSDIATSKSQQLISDLKDDLAKSQASEKQHTHRYDTMKGVVLNLKAQLQQAESEKAHLSSEAEAVRSELQKLKDEQTNGASDVAIASQLEGPMSPELLKLDASGPAKKKNKKKRKGGKAENSTAEVATGPSSPITEKAPPISATTSQSHDELRAQLDHLQGLVTDKDASIAKLQAKLKDQEALQEEIESLREDVINHGQAHVEAKARVKELLSERDSLQNYAKSLEKEIAENSKASVSQADAKAVHQSLTVECKELKTKTDALQSDLAAAQQLAASRFKDLTALRDVLQKAQPELASLRSEVTELRRSKDELVGKNADVRRLEAREKDLRGEVSKYKSQLSQKDTEIRSLNDKVNQGVSQRNTVEEGVRKMQRDLQRFQNERHEAVEAKEKLNKDLTRTSEELQTTRMSLQKLEEQFGKLSEEATSLKEEIALKTAQYASAQSLMNSMQDQAQEIGAQMKEVRERCESLEEELADAHRLLGERGREGETMRRLLADVDGRAETRIKEMREKMDIAMEERDRAEEQANTISRRRSRELEDLKNKVRDAERALSRVLEEKEELERTDDELRRQKEELERKHAVSDEEITEVRIAMGQLREALDETEKQCRELEKEKSELRKSLEECRARLDQVQKSSKSLADELKVLKTVRAGVEPSVQSSRSSIDSSPSMSRLGSPGLGKNQLPPIAAGMRSDTHAPLDYVYLKNVLLQFMEQRDKKHQMQLVPVLALLLHFDKKDEQKWMAAIGTK